MPVQVVNGLELFSPGDIDQSGQARYALETVLDWVKNFLARHHPELGRNGPVCPFVPRALDISTLWFAVPAVSEMTISGLREALDPYREAFLAIEPLLGDAAPYKTIIMVFPTVTPERATELIDGAQELLKPQYVKAGMMIGQFHPQSIEPGLHNEAFRPLRSPVPLLAVRWMVATDLPFLVSKNYSPEQRIVFLRGYMRAAQRMLAGPSNERVRSWALILEEILVDVEALLDEYPPD